MRNPCSPVTDPTAPLRQALARVLGFGRDLLGRLRLAIAPRPPPHRPHPGVANRARRHPGRRPHLAAPRHLHLPRFPGRYPSLTAQLRAECGLPPVPAATQASKDAARLRYIRRVFATQSTGRIVTRLVRRLGLKPTSPDWPTELAAITATPAQLAAQRPPNPPHLTPHPASTPQPPPPPPPPARARHPP